MIFWRGLMRLHSRIKSIPFIRSHRIIRHHQRRFGRGKFRQRLLRIAERPHLIAERFKDRRRQVQQHRFVIHHKNQWAANWRCWRIGLAHMHSMDKKHPSKAAGKQFGKIISLRRKIPVASAGLSS